MKTLEWSDNTLKLIDQTKLPHQLRLVECRTCDEVAAAIKTMQVRGAPAIGVAAAYGFALGALTSRAETVDQLLSDLARAADTLRQTRPTAVNLFWALQRVSSMARSAGGSVPEVVQAVLAEAHAMAREDEDRNRRMGRFGAARIQDGDNVLTHCNAGALATVDYGTALGVIRAAHEQGKRIHVYVDETRPLLQGARLTAWELRREGIPATLISDNMAGYLMSLGKVNLAVVGADRVVANGDVANKIGTYSVAVLAKENGIPFYVAAPTSTIDLSLVSGAEIPIEERSAREVLYVGDYRIAPEDMPVVNPAFDVTPHRYITAIITEVGVVWPPFGPGLAAAVAASQAAPQKALSGDT
ncbi:MAG: S-methyl-5-thioribose-1-phosphate isomerase [Chloroflexi bacterium]|nr:S-methyl-5-thioribose-1-phosphate isomerase [Chloroflexota bacterium]